MAKETTGKGERTRQAIMDAARAIILNEGYTAASMRKIGEGAGITPAAIYNHFESKEALFGALLEEVVPLAEMTAFLQSLQAESAQELLEKGFRGMASIIVAHEDYMRLALIDAQERDGATLVRFLPRFFPLLIGFVQQLQALDAHGRLRSLQPPIIVRSFVSMLAGYVLTERILRLDHTGAMPPFDWESGLLDILMFGLFEQPSPEKNDD